ncbi:hypothetical protein JOE66_000479 [Subtercola frigoramans]|uniref:RES domain-containing protein n=1 Tax=Subtercola frigoramans TaxID=120298 RepID=A0ABS2L189_9MICO|nr:hypothetical protein [Subtercola frigoramans]
MASKLTTRRELKLASFLGTGLRALKIEASQLTATEAADYPATVRWAEAAYDAGFDGIEYMSHRCNSDRSFSFFGGRVTADDFSVSADYGRVFGIVGCDLDWLIDFCAPLHVDVLLL